MKRTAGWKTLWLIAGLFLILSAMLWVGCGDDDDVVDDDDDDTTACGPTELCTNALACGAPYADVSECTPWYDNAVNCADMASYISCNCDCLAVDAACDPWFACGTDCFNEFCI